MSGAGELPDASGSVDDVDTVTVQQPELLDPPTSTTPAGGSRYKVLREHGRGGIGRVMAAWDKGLNREVAIKELLVADDRTEGRFVREATLTARLEHPGIVPVHEAGRWSDGRPFYAMKLVRGRSVRELIAEGHTLADRLALLPNVVAVAEAVAYAHDRQVIHRDIKPSNVMVGRFGETVVIDWGLAKDLAASDAPDGEGVSPGDRESATTHGAVVGTPGYMSPEQAAGLAVDKTTDVFALGALLFHVLGGRPPSVGAEGSPQSLEQTVPGIATELAAIVRTAMAPDPRDRYPSAQEFVDDLRRFHTGQLVSAHQYSGWQLLRRYVAQHRMVVAALAAAAVALLFGLSSVVVAELHKRDVIAAKRAADQEIRRIATAIDAGVDVASLVELEEALNSAVTKAERTGSTLESLRLPELAAPPGDDFDQHLHEVLASLGADTYAIPPSFREETRRQVTNLARSQFLGHVYDRKKTVWPVIVAELRALGLPDGLAYVAWMESDLDPAAVGPSGTAGLWQFMPDTARRFGLQVDARVDERVDPVKSSRAAARLFADQLAQFGDDAALMAIVVINTGEDRMRQMLQQLAAIPGGWRRHRRGFWRLYHLKKMTQEEMAYVPRILAAAMVDRSPSQYLADPSIAGTSSIRP